ncbi:anhydro-N-acetylmuramic acid kinase [Thalassospiraceae bacterium LMO-SO8]|nr:anhydro-N-acetylmuramic acid kinase [Alphaproteobacteria bacterium LMO-S08]WND76307.1 anhydro-N-acetylmuramic acid kinase [Thalassospiraceae bacterium LMO-SO8]
MPEDTCLAVGLMSGTSMDGVDAALIETDGEAVIWRGPALTHPYDADFRRDLRDALGHDPLIRAPENDLIGRLTDRHRDAVRALLAEAGKSPGDIRVIGFHGHTVLHRPELGVTRQIGDAARLARETGIDVAGDLRLNDVASGGEGAPLAPVYHRALARGLERPLAVLNLGGVGNVTWIGPDEIGNGGTLLAFDTGPGNALLDDWMQEKIGEPMDRDGAVSAQGVADQSVLKSLMIHDYFDMPPPKSLDRNAFDLAPVQGLSTAAGAATLAAFTVASVARAAQFFPQPAKRWLVTGGGRHNAALMQGLRRALGAEVQPVEDAGWRGDTLEAEAFAFLAVRALKGLALTYPGTTGVGEPLSGGRLYPAEG